MPDITIHKVNSVAAMGVYGVYKLNLDLTDMSGNRYVCDYISYPNDPYGINPTVRTWLSDNQGKYTVKPYTPPQQN